LNGRSWPNRLFVVAYGVRLKSSAEVQAWPAEVSSLGPVPGHSRYFDSVRLPMRMNHCFLLSSPPPAVNPLPLGTCRV